MTRKTCDDVLDLSFSYVVEKYQCDRKADHGGKHRQRFYGDDGKFFKAAIRWDRRITVIPTG